MNQTANQTEGRNKAWKLSIDGKWEEFNHYPTAKKAYENAKEEGKPVVLCRENGILIDCYDPEK